MGEISISTRERTRKELEVTRKREDNGDISTKQSLGGTKTSPEVTQRETDHRKLAREAAAEGFVLLENKDHFLPLAKGSKVGLYGAGAIRTIKGGTGSGDVNERDSVNNFQGMKTAGYDVTSSEWLEDND